MRTLLLTLTTRLFVLPANAKYSGGSGTADDPYQIATAADSMALGNEPNDHDKCFILTADIDLDPNLPGGKVVDRAVIGPDVNDASVGFEGSPFTGTIDGNGHTVSRLTIVGGEYTGLLGRLEGQLTNLPVADVDVVGTGGCVGGLAGGNTGSVTRCSSTGVVVGGASYVGGLVGFNRGSVSTSYSTGSIREGDDVGGLVGSNWGTITESYGTSKVSGNAYAGGLVGSRSSNDVVHDCFWDIQTSGQTWSAGGTAKTTAEMQTAQTFPDAGWDFVGEMANGTEDIWWILEGQDYPRLWWELIPEN